MSKALVIATIWMVVAITAAATGWYAIIPAIAALVCTLAVAFS